MQIIIFIILGLVVLGGAHYFLYFSVIRFFQITNALYKNILLAIISFLAVSFVLALFLAHWQENFFTRDFYLKSGFWLGLLVNLILASIIVWLIILVFRNTNASILAAVFFALALIYSLYGVWNAINPQIKNISVNIPGLPEQWKDKKIIQLSDVHLGIIYKDDFMRSIVEKINSINPEIVAITGDLFDGMDGNLDSLTGSLNDIKAKNGVFFVTGNHETYLGAEKVFAALEKTKVKILKDEVVDLNGLKLIGINYNNDAVFESLKNDFKGRPNILLYHSPTNIDQFKEGGVNLQLSGHTHKGQIFPFGYITKLIYSGYDYGLHQWGNFTIYTTSGAGTWGPTMRTGNTPEIVVITLQPL